MEVLSHEVTFFAHKEEFFGALQALLALPDDDASTGAAKELVDKVADIVRTHTSRKLQQDVHACDTASLASTHSWTSTRSSHCSLIDTWSLQ